MKVLPSQNFRVTMILYWVFYELAWVCANFFLIMRNWAVVLIAFARWEVIRFPLKPNKICQGKSLKLILIVLGTIGCLYGTLRMFEDRLIVCLERKSFQIEGLLFKNTLYKNITLYVGFLLLQGLGPVLSVFGFSVSLIYQIRWGNRQTELILMQSCANERAQWKRAAPKRGKSEFKNRTVLVLSIAFLIFEIPQCVVYLLFSYGILSMETSYFAFGFTELLLSFDSVSNFFIYMESNRHFRTALKALFCISHVENPQTICGVLSQ